MAHYRLYLLDDTGHIRKGMDIDCVDDAAALEKASAYVDGCAVELWQQTRRVAHLPARNLGSDRVVTLQRMGPRAWARAGQSRSPELGQADMDVAEARKSVDRHGKHVEDEMRRGNPTAAAREVLAACQAVLRQMMVHRDALVATFLKGKPKPPAEMHERPNPQKKDPRD